MKSYLLFFALISFSLAEIYTIDDLADVYYDVDSGKPVPSESIKALSGKKIKIAGYMVPFNSIENLKEFMLMPASNGCNFCESPALEEVIYVRRKGKKKYPYRSEALVIEGTLWVNGAGDPPPNSTYDTFLYAIIDPKVKQLEESQLNIVKEITPRTILKQVSGLLRTKLIKSVRFEPLDPKAWTQQRSALLKEYINTPEDAEFLFSKIASEHGGENFATMIDSVLGNWTGAASNDAGSVIYYRNDLDLNNKDDQLQIALAVYDLLFHQELPLSEILLKQPSTWDETLARLSLILGLRQSFSQFYGSIGMIEERPVTDFQTPWKSLTNNPKVIAELSSQLLVKNASFIKELYQSENFQPYTKAMKRPPFSMVQIFNPKLYLEIENYSLPKLPEESFEVPSGVETRSNRLGPALLKLLLPTLNPEDYVADVVQFYNEKEIEHFQLALLFKNEAVAEQSLKEFNLKDTALIRKGALVLIKSN